MCKQQRTYRRSFTTATTNNKHQQEERRKRREFTGEYVSNEHDPLHSFGCGVAKSNINKQHREYIGNHDHTERPELKVVVNFVLEGLQPSMGKQGSQELGANY
jgi:hypothetical protein